MVVIPGHIKTISRIRDDTYHKDSVGRNYAYCLMAISLNDEEWRDRFRKLVAMADDEHMIMSSKFRGIATENGKRFTHLQAACNVAYLMKSTGKDAWLPPNDVPAEEKEEYWMDVWTWGGVFNNPDYPLPKGWGGKKTED